MKPVEHITGPNYVAALLFAATGVALFYLGVGAEQPHEIFVAAFAAGACFTVAIGAFL